jgi:hypothetical protein
VADGEHVTRIGRTLGETERVLFANLQAMESSA